MQINFALKIIQNNQPSVYNAKRKSSAENAIKTSIECLKIQMRFNLVSEMTKMNQQSIKIVKNG